MSDATGGEGQVPQPTTDPAPVAPQAGTTSNATTVAATLTSPPVAPPPPTPEPRSIEALPLWAQAEIRDLRGEAAKRRTDQKAAEDARLKEQGEWKRLYEAKDAELSTLRDDIKRRERLDLARVACERSRLPMTFADRLRGETAEELEADAKAFAAAMPAPVAPSTEGGRGIGGHEHTGPGLPPDQAAAYLKELGIPVPTT